MDVPDIILVIQWQATCKLSTVWQYFGRAVRDHALQGTALLFAEKEYFDDVQEEKWKHQQNKKRKADAPQNQQAAKQRVIEEGTTVPVLPPTKAQSTEPEGMTDVGVSGPSPTDTLGNVSVSDTQLKELMKPNPDVMSKQKKQRELIPAMDWLINAHLWGIGCHRKVFDLPFDNVSALVGES
jgi:hypothetical protein